MLKWMPVNMMIVIDMGKTNLKKKKEMGSLVIAHNRNDYIEPKVATLFLPCAGQGTVVHDPDTLCRRPGL